MKYLLFLIIVASSPAYAQNYLLKNEKLIFSFDTKQGKHMTLAKDKSNKYIVYRFGTTNKIEFEFPEKNESSWKKFKYYFFLRGGGVQNEGEDRNYILFTNKGIKYSIYDNYYARGNTSIIGIKVTDTRTGKKIDLKGVYKTRKGSMVDFRDNNLLEIEDEPEE